MVRAFAERDEQAFAETSRKVKRSILLRPKQVNQVFDHIESCPVESFVCGDFNDSPISYTCHRLKGQLDDAYISSGNGPGISYNRHGMYYRIDHILHSSTFKAYDCTVDCSIKMSDHYPIFCFLEKR